MPKVKQDAMNQNWRSFRLWGLEVNRSTFGVWLAEQGLIFWPQALAAKDRVPLTVGNFRVLFCLLLCNWVSGSWQHPNLSESWGLEPMDHGHVGMIVCRSNESWSFGGSPIHLTARLLPHICKTGLESCRREVNLIGSRGEARMPKSYEPWMWLWRWTSRSIYLKLIWEIYTSFDVIINFLGSTDSMASKPVYFK